MADCAAATILIRHADVPANGENDPDLSEAGHARADALADLLRDAGVAAIIVTDTVRSQRTAEPLATNQGITPAIVALNVNDIAANVAAVLDSLSELPAATTALVVGHTLTVPRIIRGLDGPAIPEIPHTDFDHLYVLAGGCLTHLRFRG